MNIIDSSIDRPKLLEIQSISDDRGLLIPLTDHISEDLLKRSYLVEDYGKGVIRGLHYHKEEYKIFTIATGAAKFITIELPQDLAEKNVDSEIEEFVSKNPDCLDTWVLSSRHHAVLIVPANFANGWISLENHTVLVSLSNLRFEKAKDDDIRIDPYIVEEEWEVKGR